MANKHIDNDSSQRGIVAFLVSDPHISGDNYEYVRGLFDQVTESMLHRKANRLIVLGDFMQYRRSQTLASMLALRDILESVLHKGIVIDGIDGNHDKVDDRSCQSYPGIIKLIGFRLHHESFSFQKGNVVVHLLPYFRSEDYMAYLESIAFPEFPTGDKNILLTHMDIAGGLVNGGGACSVGIPVKAFKKFDLVISGHYHNRSSISNVKYMGSMYPANFGEDNDKGYAILYDDGSISYHNLKFDEFGTEKLLIESEEEASAIRQRIHAAISSLNTKYKRIVLIGGREMLDAIDVSEFESLGIRIDKDKIDLISSIPDTPTPVTQTSSSILEHFSTFCEEKGYELESGLKILREALKQ